MNSLSSFSVGILATSDFSPLADVAGCCRAGSPGLLWPTGAGAGAGRSVVTIPHPATRPTHRRWILALAAPKLHRNVKGRLEEWDQVRQLVGKSFPLIGVLFLALGIFKLIQGDSWVVWFILGVVFGGLGVFSRRQDKER